MYNLFDQKESIVRHYLVNNAIRLPIIKTISPDVFNGEWIIDPRYLPVSFLAIIVIDNRQEHNNKLPS